MFFSKMCEVWLFSIFATIVSFCNISITMVTIYHTSNPSFQ